MPVIVSLLRAVNLPGHQQIKKDTLRTVYESLGLRDVQTYVQSGNVVFRTSSRNLARLASQIEAAIEQTAGFRPDVILRTSEELADAIARNPFAGRSGIDPARLLVMFAAGDPGPEAREKVLRIKTDPEELRIDGRELYIYFPNGMARPKLSLPALARALKVPATGRNWNSVTKLLEIARKLESSGTRAKPVA